MRIVLKEEWYCVAEINNKYYLICNNECCCWDMAELKLILCSDFPVSTKYSAVSGEDILTGKFLYFDYLQNNIK